MNILLKMMVTVILLTPCQAWSDCSWQEYIDHYEAKCSGDAAAKLTALTKTDSLPVSQPIISLPQRSDPHQMEAVAQSAEVPTRKAGMGAAINSRRRLIREQHDKELMDRQSEASTNKIDKN